MIRTCLPALLLLACSKPAPDPALPKKSPPPAAVPTAPAGEQVANSDAVRGEWRVAGVAGRPVDQAEAITASIRREEIHAVAGCLRWNWGYRLADGALTMRRRPSASPPCARPLTQTEREFEAAMPKASFAVRRPDASLVLSGPGGEVVLFRQ